MNGILKTTLNDLNLPLTLAAGQCFRWRKRSIGDSTSSTWLGIIGKRCFELTQRLDSGEIEWRHLNPHKSVAESNGSKRRRLEANEENLHKILHDYFQLDVPLTDFYKQWSVDDENFAVIGQRMTGVRMLRQDPIETVFSFICSSNNNIIRITKMVDALCSELGEELMMDNEFGKVHAFPSVENLAAIDESTLRKWNFGYRAKFIVGAAKKIIDSANKAKQEPAQWLLHLRTKSYEETHETLKTLPGIGSKVADCICLMAMDKSGAIPVDTHVWKIARTGYMPHLMKQKSCTEKAYVEIGEFFRQRFGPYAGWAHSVLFCAELRHFQEKIGGDVKPTRKKKAKT